MNPTFRLAAAGLLAAMASGTAYAGQAERAAVEKALSNIKAHAAETRLSSSDSFKLRDVIIDADGSQHVRFDRVYSGLRVIGGDLVVHADALGAFRSVSQTLRTPVGVDTRAATVGAKAAKRFAESLFEGSREGSTRSKLVIYARGEQPLLAHEVVIKGVKADGTPSSAHLIVAADSLRLLDRWDTVMTDASAGTGNSLFGGVVPLTTDSQAEGGYEMLDPTRGSHYTVTMKNRKIGLGTVLTDSDNVWGDSTTVDKATVGVDATYGQNMTFDFYLTKLGRNGIANDGAGGYSRVHYGKSYSNAFWNDDCFCMTYGDGNGSSLLPLVSLDIAGHEMTHGVTSHTAGLIYSGESGGLNEGTSDIFGTMVEYYAANTLEKANYLVGERIYTANAGNPTPTTALRYMFKPSLDGTSPDCYFKGIGNLDVHYSSGIANHFYYLMAQGTAIPAGFTLTSSDLVCSGPTTLTGLGRGKAQKVMYRALTVYMTSSTDYAGARAATLSAAADYYGSGSVEYATVAGAWSAVNVE